MTEEAVSAGADGTERGSGGLDTQRKGRPARLHADDYLLFAALAVGFVALGLLLGLYMIRSGMQELRNEAFPSLPSRAELAKPPKPSVPAESSDTGLVEESPGAFLAIELKHDLPSGLLAVLVDDQVVHEAALFSREHRGFFFRTVTDGEMRAAFPLEPGTHRIKLHVRSQELGFEVEAETTSAFESGDWRLLVARLRPEDNALEVRWRQ